MKFQESDQNRRDKGRLQDFLREQRAGARLSYVEIERGAGVKMDERGKRLLRRACEVLGLHPISIPGCGIELTSGANAAERVRRAHKRTINAVERETEVADAMLARHGDDMPPSDRQKVTMHRAMLGALNLSRTLAEKTKEENASRAAALRRVK